MNVVTPSPLPNVVDKYEMPVERIFQNSGVGGNNPSLAGDMEDGGPYGQTIRELIDDAKSFEESTLAPDREENLQYFYGEIPAVEGEGTSTAISTDVRDTVMAILPSLIRIFTSAEHVVTCQPNYAGQEEAAKQCTDYLQYMFWDDNPGFLILHDIIKDALRCKIGVVKWWTDTNSEVVEQSYNNITEEQIQLLIFENPELEIIDAVPAEGMEDPSTNTGPPPSEMESGLAPDPALGGESMMPEGLPPIQTYESITVRFTKSKPLTKIESVPLDEFRIDRRAKTVESARLIGHDRVTQVSELIEAGYSMEELEPYLGATSSFSTDRQYRNEGIDETSVQANLDIRYGCYYIRIDKDGDGIAELREIHTVGDNHAIIHDEVVQNVNYAVWCPDPEPHTLVGDTPAELVKDIQRVKTSMLRGALDSLAQSIWPRTVYNETLVNTDDVLNDEIGAAIRTKGDAMTSVQSLQHIFVGQPVFQMFEVMEVLRQQRTGINDASKGVDPRALQSTSVQGVDAIVTGAQERIELCARILAETGMTALFKGLLRECVNSPNQKRTIQLRGKWVDVNPSTFDPSMRIKVNPTLGKGSDMTRLMVLQDIKQTQLMAMEKYGVDNPLCGPIEFRNTLTDMLALGNIKNVDRYFKEITPEVLQSIQQAPKEPDPALLLAQSDMEKTKANVAKAIAESDFDDRKLRMEDDFRRDELKVKSILDAAKIEAQFAYDVDELELSAAQTVLDAANADADREGADMDRQIGVATGDADRMASAIQGDTDREFSAEQAQADRDVAQTAE
jgi:hypothetical protein